MGRKKKNGWFSKVKKALTHDSKEKITENKCFEKENPSITETVPDPVTEELLPPEQQVKFTEVENDAHSAAIETMASQPAKSTEITEESKNEIAAVRIQTAFRSYTARKALRALKGVVRLKSLVDGPIVKRQTSNTLKCMQTLTRMQSQIQSTRIRMLEENRAIQRQLIQKRAKELETLKMSENWDDSMQSKEKMEEDLLHKYEAATRRERALAYSYTHQQTWKKSSKTMNLLFMDPMNFQWGWSWLERWMVPKSNDAVKSSPEKDINEAGVISQKLHSSTHPSPATSSAGRRVKIGGTNHQEDDSKSAQSEKNRRYTIDGLSISKDDESSVSSSSVPSYMASTHSTKAKLKIPSPLGSETKRVSEKADPKKRLSFPPSPVRPRKVEAS